MNLNNYAFQNLLNDYRWNNPKLKNVQYNKTLLEIRNNMQFREGNEIMNQLGDLDTGDILQENIQNIMRQQQQDMQNLRILENGNNAINANLGIKNEDDYLKSLLGTAGAAPAY